MPNLKPLTKQRWVISFDGGADIVFDTLTGVEAEASATDYNDGSTGQTKSALGFIKYSNITLSKTADEETDTALRQFLETKRTDGNQPFQLSYQAVTVNRNGDPISGYSPITVTECQVRRVKYPEVDRTSDDLAKWEIEIIVNGEVK